MTQGEERRAQILAFIRAHIVEQQCAPTVREICAHCGMNSSNGVQEHLVILEQEGKIALSKRAGGPVRSRGLRVLGARLQWVDDEVR